MEEPVFDFITESPDNYEQKSLCVLLLDTSGSMNGKPLSELQKGLDIFYEEIKEDSVMSKRLEIAIITYDSLVEIKQEPALVESFTMPILNVRGMTCMTEGIERAIELVNERKNWYKQTGQPYYRPWIIMMTDGEPNDDSNIDTLADKIQTDVNNKNYFFFTVGVENANMQILEHLSSTQMPPAKIEGLKFSSFFKWLSASINTAQDDDTWLEGFVLPEIN